MEFKINIADPKSGKTAKQVVTAENTKAFLGKKIGDKIAGDQLSLDGYELEITGGSDYCGFPMRRDVLGVARKRILVVSGVGVRKNVRGRKIRKTVAGNTINPNTAQINLKVLKAGSKPLLEEPKQEKSKAAGE